MTGVNRFERGLMTGRFQPFHNGHLALAEQALSECDELVIVIGSAQFSFIEKDPFTAGERVLMIRSALAEAGIDLARCYIIPVANDENNARWLAHLRSQVPPFDVLYSGNNFVEHLARSQDPTLAVRKPKFAKKMEYNGTNIRLLAMTGKKKWEHLVPPAVARAIKSAGGVERMRMLARSDSDPARW
ncbi:MAG TPA: nicotinamide-nucleotide adenylyltransferase [Nitrososphaera sp.]|nr:nicotinamide-nucleotide adenylyltransferase [Nitrososphaera sp.]